MSPIPVTLVLGRPESVRQALLRQWLCRADQADTLLLAEARTGAVLAHPYFAPIRPADVPMASPLQSACACCVPQRGLATALREATWRFARGGVRQYARVIVDTDVADPAPVLRTLSSDAAVTAHYRLTRVVAVADPGSPPWVLDAAAAAQWAVADTLIVPSGTSVAAQSWLREAAPDAQVVDADSAEATPAGDLAPSRAASAWLSQSHPADFF